jgi:hypothetical protein
VIANGEHPRISESWGVEPTEAFFSMSLKLVLRFVYLLLSLASMIPQASFAQSQ